MVISKASAFELLDKIDEIDAAANKSMDLSCVW